MGTFLFGVLKNLVGYIASKLLKPEKLVELILDLADIAAKRTDTKWDDNTVKAVREALDHKE
ncbi:hypothetical protein VPMG_00070 [Vibrio phage VBP32]|uniref:Uncharacterized protein n=2 Tax=Stoningtonvirus VBP47 TaxID=2846606 RepID=M4SM41_9CAUD|nr:hypothetical protein VPNG_00059 [Vibrio phage VBP47]YP_007676560.1 hypothetical protein VPMG_00070 [Vibrio phage VBP32]AGH57083.1 hypothetical protein VPNG_00059 [Vibrio phage VBP47]AGH57209.1 hypothetical protein VPMG_00070 [Vibrio phage VBP32]